MTKPCHHLVDALDARPIGKQRPRDHDDAQAKFARGVDLGARAVPAGISCDQPFDVSGAHQFEIALACEGTARNDDLGVRKWQRLAGRIDKSERVDVLRLGREWRDVLPADREEDMRAGLRQRRERFIEITHFDPSIARDLRPWRAFECDQRSSRRSAGFDCVTTHLGGKGMSRVDHMRDLCVSDEVSESSRPAEAADAGRYVMAEWDLRAACIGVDRVNLRAHNLIRELVGVARSAQNEGAHRG